MLAPEKSNEEIRIITSFSISLASSLLMRKGENFLTLSSNTEYNISVFLEHSVLFLINTLRVWKAAYEVSNLYLSKCNIKRVKMQQGDKRLSSLVEKKII